ncbi:MAG: efflux RND transporter permease subunit [Deltaproteobacteria bacterium]|nr:MAG: efflux RND transporter permease subunit [Deltaproteobacteria bacterium]
MSEPQEPARPEAPTESASGLLALAIRRPVGVLVGVILIVLFGLFSLFALPIQLTPDIEIPTLTVTTRWPGAAPAEVEQELLEPQEEALKTLQGLTRMTSEATSDQGQITLEMKVGTNLDEALSRITNLLTQVPSYPENSDEPIVSTGNAAGPPLAVVLLQSPSGDDVGHYRTWVEEEVLPPLERIPGVASIDLFGGRDSEVVVSFEPDQLAARGLPLTQVAAAVRAELRDLTGGEIDMGKRRYIVRTMARPPNVEDLEDIVVRPAEGSAGAVRLGDVAKVSVGLRIQRAYVYGNDREALAVLFRREAGSNVLETTEMIREGVAEVQRDLLDAEGLELRIVNDQTDYIYGALALVRQNLLIGAVLAALVLWLFLRSIPAAGVVSVSIPVCVIGTALGMALLGRSVNVVSLAGIAFAVGMVVDNAIVVLENIDSWRARASSAAEAALIGVREVWGAILASTVTTAAVFIPIITWQDEVGELLRDVAVAISFAVVLSLGVSVLVIPSFSARLLRQGSQATGGVGRLGGRLRAAVVWGVRRIVESVPVALLISLLVPAGLAGVGWALLPSMEYLPEGNRNFLFGVMIPPPGYSMDEMKRVGAAFQESIDRHRLDEVDGVPRIERSFFVARPEQAFMGGGAVDGSRIGELVARYRQEQRRHPGLFGVANQAGLFARGLGSSRAIDIDITGPDLVELLSVGREMMGQIAEVIPGSQVQPLPSLDLGGPELQVFPRREDALRLGLTGEEIGLVVDALVDGRIVGELARPGRRKLDVTIRPVGVAPTSKEALENASVATPLGGVVPLSSLADVVETVGPTKIRRLERRQGITLQLSPPDDLPLEATLERLQDRIVAPMVDAGLSPGVRISYAGAADKLVEAQTRLGQVLMLAMLISFLLLSALYEDFLAPIVVLVTVPLAAAGGVIGLRLVDLLLAPQAFDLLTAMGFIILIGVVVNNAILVVDVALSRLREGALVTDALADAVERRARPIAMSAMTSLAGLLPLVLFPGSGSELYRGVGAIVLGGLALSTALTLFVVPAVFRLVWWIARRA